MGKRTQMVSNKESTKSSNNKKLLFKDIEKTVDAFCFNARCTFKSSIKNYAKGRLFTCHFLDSSGECKCIAFDEVVNMFHEQIAVGKTYSISKVHLIESNRQFDCIDNIYNIKLTSDSMLIECEDEEDIPHNKYSFCPLSDIHSKNKNDVVDVIGIVKKVNDLETINSKNGSTFVKRNVVIKDGNNYEINVSLWNDNARNCNYKENSIIIYKGAKIMEFNAQKYVSVQHYTVVSIDDISVPEVELLQSYLAAEK